MVNPREDTTIQSCFSLTLTLSLSFNAPILSNKKQWSDVSVWFFLDAFSCLLCCNWEEKRKSDCWKLSEYDRSLNEEIVLRSDSWRRETPMFMGLLLDYFYCYSSSWWISEPVTAADKGVKEKREGGMLWVRSRLSKSETYNISVSKCPWRVEMGWNITTCSTPA